MFEIFDKFGEILGVFDSDGVLDDRGDGEFYDFEVVGGFVGGKGIRFEQELININQIDNVIGGYIIDRFDFVIYYQDGMLDSFDEEIFFFVRGVVGILDMDFEIGVDSI